MDSSSLPTIYFDESGNAGENLLHQEQPVFTLASVLLDADTARKIVSAARSELGPGNSQGELKYSRLRRTSRGRDALAAGLLAVDGSSVKVYVLHKRWMVVTKFVDLLIGERINQLGGDIYAGGLAPEIANLLYNYGPKLGSPKAFDAMLSTFVKFAWNPNGEGVFNLMLTVYQYVESLSSEGFDAIGLLLSDLTGAAHAYVQGRALGEHEDTLDPAIPCLYYLCRSWFGKVGEFNIIHDKSRVMTKSLDLFRESSQLEDPLHPGEKLPAFPVVQFDFADSKSIPQLQVVDWIAGAVCTLGKSVAMKQRPPFEAKLQDHMMKWVVDSMFSGAEDNYPF